MNRTAASLAILALGLAACASTPSTTEQRVATTEMPYRAGQGEVIAVSQARPPISAAAGGTATAASTAPANYRLAIRMDDGSLQYVDTDAAELTVGSRVELGPDHTIRGL
jgi:predicted outer membrane protein